MRQFAAAVLTGWALVMALGWFLANQRAARCSDTYNCTVNELATRDAFLITGLIVPLLLIAALFMVRARVRPAGQTVLAKALPAASQRNRFRTRLDAFRIMLPPRLKVPSLAWIIAAFCMGWACAYGMLVILPARSAAPRDAIDSEARDAAVNAAAAAEGPWNDWAPTAAQAPSNAEEYSQPVYEDEREQPEAGGSEDVSRPKAATATLVEGDSFPTDPVEPPDQE